MRLTDLLTPDSVFAAVKAANKKQLLLDLSERVASIAKVPAREVFDALLQRERLGSTGIGDGVAIPHGKLARVKAIIGLFARLDRPIEFDSLDGAPVDLVFLLIAPENAGADHLKALACAARVLRDPGFIASVRATRDDAALYSLITRSAKPFAA